MSNRAIRIVGFMVAGVLAVELARVYPRPVVVVMGVITLGVVLSHADELATLVGVLVKAEGH